MELTPTTRQIDFPSLADGGNLAPVNNHHGIGNFFKRGEGSIGVDDNRLHKVGIILLDRKQNCEARGRVLWNWSLKIRFVSICGNLFPTGGFLSLGGRQC
jgi:hypothetical protein